MTTTVKLELTGNRESFFKLFNKHNYLIEIPTIQRDYAQGRKSKVEVRELFLQALYDYLQENIPNRDLDFVYGSNEEVEGISKFIPLDGQQRLTTLFLLHWYLAKLNGDDTFKFFQEKMTSNGKSKFTYLTRPSSSEFMNALLLNSLDFNCLSESDNGEQNSLSKTIMNQGWYFLSWGYDPSISSMLNMLDAIHAKFNGNPEFYERLIDVNSPIITFLFLDLKKFKLTEDLYIKMNSRGKPLTAFENFKAKFEQHISNLIADTEKCFKLPPNRSVSCREYFADRIDTTWANLFWHYRHLVGKPNTYDEELMNFIRTIISSQYCIQNHEQLDHLRELVKNESATSEITENLSFYKFEAMGALTKECITYLIDALDVLGNNECKLVNHLTDNFYFNESDIFEKALKYSLSFPERALFHAYLRYLIINKNDISGLHQWMRVVHNLIENSRIEAVPELVSAIRSLEQLLPHSNNIINYLISSDCRIEFFASWQIVEERLKAHLFVSDPWLQRIEDCEKQIFHKGQISYIFEFAKIFEYFNQNANVNWSKKDDEAFSEKFMFYRNQSIALFSIVDTEDNKEYLVERSILSKGNYLIETTTPGKLNFCSSKKVANYQRDYSWKRLLRYTSDIESLEWAARRSYVNDVLTDQLFDKKNAINSLNKIIQILPTDWRSNFVKNPGLIAYCRQGFICMTEDGEVELFSQTQLNHYHINSLLYNFFIEYSPQIDNFAPFEEITYYSVKNNEDSSFLQLSGYRFKNKSCTIDITRVVNNYLIEFLREKRSIKRVDYDSKLEALLLKNGMEWDELGSAFIIKKRTGKSTYDFINLICKELLNLKP